MAHQHQSDPSSMVLLVKPWDHGLIDRHAFAGFSLHLMQHTGMCKMPGFYTAHHHQILQHFLFWYFSQEIGPVASKYK